MAMKGHVPGGGIASKQHVQTPVRTGSGAREVRPGGAGQLGASQGSHLTNKGDSGYRGEVLYGGQGMNPVPYGNAKALDVGPGGCGTGRTIYKTGTQQQYGSGGPPKPEGRDMLSAFGPESSRPRNDENY